MKIWRATLYDSDAGTLYAWRSNKRDAEKELTQFQRERGKPADGPESVDAVEIPTNKAGLIKWLNTNFTSDNG